MFDVNQLDFSKILNENKRIWSMNISSNSLYDETWSKFSKNSCISIDYVIENVDIDYSSFKSKDEIKDYLNDDKSIQPSVIWRFINEIKNGDLFIAHKGTSTLTAIGVVESDYIHQEGDLKNIRKVNWFYIGDVYIKKTFFAANNLINLSLYRGGINQIICSFARINENIRNNLFNFIYSKFYNEYYTQNDHKDAYYREKKYIREEWSKIQEKYENGESVSDLIWERILNRKVRVFGDGASNVKKSIQSRLQLSDEDMDKTAMLFFNTINSLVNLYDVDKQRKILNDYYKNEYSNGLRRTGRLTPVLYYLDNSYYPINSKSIKTVKLLSLILGEEIKLSNNLNDYIDSNFIYHKFLEDLADLYEFDKLRINDYLIFDEFTHWLCDKNLGYYFDDNTKAKVNIFPLSFSMPNIKFDGLKRNIIYFGAPGTGKSYNLNKDMEALTSDYERVTFHPDYSYANFVGTYKPVPKGESISYEYVPGPFMRSLVKSLKNPENPFLLIIEEINRANVAAVFGDVFQLLDRDFDNESRYAIETTEDMRNYLKRELNEDFDKIKIPSNLFIWATMNSADQGVFPMDTAFKRRWDFKYFGINHNEELVSNIKVELNSQLISWNDLRKAINEELLSYRINEDKLLGPFFAFNEYLKTDIPVDEFKDIFKNKIIMYLFEDAARSKRNELFSGVAKNTNLTYSQICEAFDEKGIEIFCDNIKEKFVVGDE